MIQNRGGTGAARRLERAADLVPNLENKFTPGALRETFTGDNASGVMVMNPKDFEKFATPLTQSHKTSSEGFYRIGNQFSNSRNRAFHAILEGSRAFQRSDAAAERGTGQRMN